MLKIINLIPKLLEEKQISILKLSEAVGITYSAAHSLVKRDTLNTTKFETLVSISNYLKVDIRDLFEIKKG